jgi:hypothetical protein
VQWRDASDTPFSVSWLQLRMPELRDVHSGLPASSCLSLLASAGYLSRTHPAPPSSSLWQRRRSGELAAARPKLQTHILPRQRSARGADAAATNERAASAAAARRRRSVAVWNPVGPAGAASGDGAKEAVERLLAVGGHRTDAMSSLEMDILAQQLELDALAASITENQQELEEVLQVLQCGASPALSLSPHTRVPERSSLALPSRVWSERGGVPPHSLASCGRAAAHRCGGGHGRQRCSDAQAC